MSHHSEKINSKYSKNLNLKPETIRLLEENLGKKVISVGFGHDCFGHDAKSTENQSKNKRMELHKLKHVCTVKQKNSKTSYRIGNLCKSYIK